MGTPARQLLQRLSQDSNQGERQERPSQKLLSASSPPSPQLPSLPQPTSASFHSNPSHLLSCKPGWAQRQDSLQTAPGPTTFRSLPAPRARPEAPEQPCMSQAPGLSPLHRPVAHLSLLAHCTQQCVHVSDASSATMLHGSFQELSRSCDPALAPLAPQAPSCGHQSRSPSEQLYRAITHCCIITLLRHRIVASSHRHAAARLLPSRPGAHLEARLDTHVGHPLSLGPCFEQGASTRCCPAAPSSSVDLFFTALAFRGQGWSWAARGLLLLLPPCLW